MIESRTAFIEHVTEGANGSRETRLSSALTRAGAPSPAETLAELARVVSSPDFRASPRNRRALEYLVQSYLEGREDELSAYNIATHVYRRPPSFDPIKDPIVRIEMAGLRRDLEVYYLKSGVRNPLRISIPKGGYVPWVAPAPQAVNGTTADGEPLSRFMVCVLRAALCVMDGQQREAAVAWHELLRCDPDRLGNLHESVLREIGDEELTRQIVDGVLRAARGKLSD